MAGEGQSGFDWSRMEKMMGTQFPFVPKDLINLRSQSGGDWVGQYVEEILKRSFGGSFGGESEEEEDLSQGEPDGERRGGSGEKKVRTQVRSPGIREEAPVRELDYDYEVFETHNSVIVRITVPRPVLIRNLRLYAGSMRLKLELDPSRSKLYIPLPCPIDVDGARALYKNRVLELRLPKVDETEVFQEIRIRQR